MESQSHRREPDCSSFYLTDGFTGSKVTPKRKGICEPLNPCRERLGAKLVATVTSFVTVGSSAGQDKSPRSGKSLTVATHLFRRAASLACLKKSCAAGGGGSTAAAGGLVASWGGHDWRSGGTNAEQQDRHRNRRKVQIPPLATSPPPWRARLHAHRTHRTYYSCAPCGKPGRKTCNPNHPICVTLLASV